MPILPKRPRTLHRQIRELARKHNIQISSWEKVYKHPKINLSKIEAFNVEVDRLIHEGSKSITLAKKIARDNVDKWYGK